MVDIFTRKQRSLLMGRIRGKNTRPELAVRRLITSLGFRFRLHQVDLPGRPDIVLHAEKKVVFVNGCFWHRHHCSRAYSPKTRLQFWDAKFAATLRRDRRTQAKLRREGWGVLVAWECELGKQEILKRRLARFLDRISRKTDSRKCRAQNRK
jgi:DNA mismatch endonuclease, patch repair protein